ncbi:ABC transporter permease [Bowdeniella nasicola]|uniref:ABC transporter permease n=1 Tax=Bowdeniella nasicola TaxID=208480 RepID=A0A1Q5Q5A7_9ACTO|nr:ABC transporter permease [Bowdeniella nasicola]
MPLLWSYVRPHRKTLVAGLVLGLAATGITLATPLVVKWVLDSLAISLDLTWPVTALVILLVVGSVANLSQSVLMGRLAETIVLDARRSLIRRFLRAKLEPVQRFRSGELITRVTSDTSLLREATTTSIVELINGVISIVGTIILMAVLDLPLLVTTLLSLLVIVLAFVILVPKIGQADKRSQDEMGELGAMLEGSFRALRTVKSSQAESREIARVNAKAEESTRHSIRSVWYVALVGTVAVSGVQLATIIILAIGAGRVATGGLDVSTLVAFLLYAFNIVEPISLLAGAVSSVQSGLAAAARIRETEHLQEENTTAVPAGAAPAPRGEPSAAPVLALRDVTARYHDATNPALAGVTLEIPRTGHVALVGPSGAGKTTIFSLILRFIEPASGTLELDGVPYDHLAIADVRSRIAYVEQETPVIPGTVRDNVLFRIADDPSDEEAWQALAAVRLDDKIRSLDGGFDADVSETRLSGGERQRLAIARVLVRQPDILLLDEATAQLDGTTEAAIQDVIAKASKSGVVVTIAHRLSTVLDADQIVVFEAGRIRDAGTHHELLDRDELYQEFIAALRIYDERAR